MPKKITLTEEEIKFCNSIDHADAKICVDYYDPEDEHNGLMTDEDETVQSTIYVNALPALKNKVANYIKVLKSADDLKLSSEQILELAGIFADFLTDNDWKDFFEDVIDDEEMINN